MLSTNIRKTLLALSALPSALLSTGCGNVSVEPIKPAPERVAEVPAPPVPEGNVACAYDATLRCLDDSQNAELLDGYAAALDAANAKLHWLAIFFGFTDK